jgi:uncharacterized protein YpbB
MESGWIINFKNGYRVILDEAAYKRLKTDAIKKEPEEIRSEEHWFSIEEAIKKNPRIEIIKIADMRRKINEELPEWKQHLEARFAKVN